MGSTATHHETAGDTQRARTDEDESQAAPPDTKDGDDTGKDTDDKDEAKAKPMSPAKKRVLVIVGLLVAALAVVGWLAYRRHSQQYESTDDAFIDGNQSKVSPRVSGQVLRLHVTDNQVVRAGEPLFDLDPRDLQLRLQQQEASAANAAAEAAQARTDLLSLRAALRQDLAQVRVAESDSVNAREDLARYSGASNAAVARRDVDQSTANARSTSAKLDAARQVVAGAQAQLLNQDAKIRAAEATYREARAAVEAAKLQLTYTHVVAPQAGRVTQRTVNLGDYVNPGQALMAVVPEQVWVTANFKETQLKHMRVGQPVRITVDAYPDSALAGHVESLQSGTGSFFSTLPAENATGNYVKVVQRLPVRIAFDGDAWRRLPLAPGLSVKPRVTVQ